MRDPDELQRRLTDAATAIDVDAPDVDAIRSIARRRRTRSRLAAGLGAAALAVTATVAVVAVTRDREPDTIATVDPEEAPSTTEPAATVLDTAPPITPSAQTVEVLDRTPAIGRAMGEGGAPEYGEWVAAWNDGFLVGAIRSQPQPLPDELPEDIVALFPQEVVDLFGGELPATIEEATDMLSEAGLLDEVADVIAANPDASAAIYGAETAAPSLDVRFTTDGATWEPVEMTMPAGAQWLSNVTGVGDRLVATFTSFDPTTGRNPDGRISVASTTDLVAWDVQEIVVPPPPVELPEGVTWTAEPTGLAATETSWLAGVYAGISFDPVALLPDDVAREVGEGNAWPGQDADGIFLEREDGDRVVYPWDELGVAPEVVELLVDQSYDHTLWVGDWNGASAPADAELEPGSFVATSAGFMAFGRDVRFSADGADWSTVPLPVDDAVGVNLAFGFDGGVVVAAVGRDGTDLIRLDETGASAEVLDIPGLPEHAAPLGPGSSLGTVLDAAEPPPPPPPLVVEHAGYRLTLDGAAGEVEVVELATGELVVSAPFGWSSTDEQPITFGDDGVTVDDPETGEAIVVFPRDVVDAAQERMGGPVEYEYAPDTWLLASADGERFVVDDLDDGDAHDWGGPSLVVGNGTRLLVQTPDGWVSYDLS